MYTIIVKYYSPKDKEIHIKEVEAVDLIDAVEIVEIETHFDAIFLSASYKNECEVIKDSINEE